MTVERINSPRHLTFSQRLGYEPLPEPMRLEELSDDLRREVWNAVYALLEDGSDVDLMAKRFFYPDCHKYIRKIWGRLTKAPESRIKVDYNETAECFERIILSEKFNVVLDLLEILIEEHDERRIFAANIETLFERHAAAYWLDTSQRPYWFIPRVSKEQGEATQKAIETVHQGEMYGGANHLRQAGEAMRESRYADSVRHSIHAVESVARTIDPESSKTLGPALKSLERAGVLEHPALRVAFEKLYGYTSDAQGIRHPVVDKDAPDVGLDEAVFMFGACASFAAYLTKKYRQASNA